MNALSNSMLDNDDRAVFFILPFTSNKTIVLA